MALPDIRGGSKMLALHHLDHAMQSAVADIWQRGQRLRMRHLFEKRTAIAR
jgi:hypothetical protein